MYEFYFEVMERAMFHVDNSYHIPNTLISGFLCKTNTPSNTAFRGFGGPQGMFMTEAVITDVAEKLQISPEQVREYLAKSGSFWCKLSPTITCYHWKQMIALIIESGNSYILCMKTVILSWLWQW